MDRFRDIDGPQHSDHLRAKLIEGVLELNNIKKGHSDNQQKQLRNQLRISELQENNKNLKQTLVLELTRKEQVLAKSNALTSAIKKLTHQIEDYKQETDTLMDMYQRSFNLIDKSQ